MVETCPMAMPNAKPRKCLQAGPAKWVSSGLKNPLMFRGMQPMVIMRFAFR